MTDDHAVTPRVTHVAAYHRPYDFYLSGLLLTASAQKLGLKDLTTATRSHFLGHQIRFLIKVAQALIENNFALFEFLCQEFFYWPSLPGVFLKKFY